MRYINIAKNAIKQLIQWYICNQTPCLQLISHKISLKLHKKYSNNYRTVEQQVKTISPSLKSCTV